MWLLAIAVAGWPPGFSEVCMKFQSMPFMPTVDGITRFREGRLRTHDRGSKGGPRNSKEQSFVPVGYLRQLCPDDAVAPLSDETPGTAMVEQHPLSAHSVAISDP